MTGRIDCSMLNPEQREAVFSGHRRILCLAGAGTGKTQALTRRMARLWETGTSTENMLALTFTRAAGAEMKERVIGLIGGDGKKLFCDTFHAFCMQVAREFSANLGYGPDFSVYGQQEAEELMGAVLADLRLKIPAKRIAEARAGDFAGMGAAARKQAETALGEYRHRLRRSNAIDFDGLIEAALEAMGDPGISGALRARHSHVFVDEFQDTDPAQWEIVKRLGPGSLFVVGDDFQSIYGFRGSDVSIILGLANDPEWQTVKLERNYRSTMPIVGAANALIKHNRQTRKSLLTDRLGPAVEFREPGDDSAEIAEIAGRLSDAQKAGRTTAVLARTNRQLQKAKAILESHGTPCETGGAEDGPMEGASAKLLLSWAAAIENPQDEAALRRIALEGMGMAAFLEAERVQLHGMGTFAEALRSTVEGACFWGVYSETAEKFKEIAEKQEGGGVAAGMRCLAGLLAKIGPAGKALDAIAGWERRRLEIGEQAAPKDLLFWARSRAFAEKRQKSIDAGKTYLMTAHGSKGLEFDEVYIIGAAQGTFPGRGDLEEERRLFYVAMTRAREILNVSRPLAMEGWGGGAATTERSQFLAEALIV